MTAASALARGRQRAMALMVDAGEVTRPGTATPGTINEDTGRYEGGTAALAVYSGRCRLQIRGMGSSTTSEAGGAEWTVVQTILQLPVSAGDVRVGDRFTLTGSQNMAHMVGRTYDVGRPLSDKTHATKREFLLTEAGLA